MEKIKAKLPTYEIVLWQYSANNEGKHPLKIRITYDRKSFYYPVQSENENVFLHSDYWAWDKKDRKPGRLEYPDKLKKDVKEELKRVQRAINSTSTLAEDAIQNCTRYGRQFTWARFEKEFLQQESKRGFLKIFEDHLKELKENNRIGTYRAYISAFEALREFQGAIKEPFRRGFRIIKPAKDFNPVDLTPAYLKKFEAFLLKRGLTKDSIAIYMRAIRVILNLIISENPALAEYYPFERREGEKNKYKIKKGSGKKGSALTVEQIQNLLLLKPGPDYRNTKRSFFSSFPSIVRA
jgi:integrase/recombinase XerD